MPYNQHVTQQSPLCLSHWKTQLVLHRFPPPTKTNIVDFWQLPIAHAPHKWLSFRYIDSVSLSQPLSRNASCFLPNISDISAIYIIIYIYMYIEGEQHKQKKISIQEKHIITHDICVIAIAVRCSSVFSMCRAVGKLSWLSLWWWTCCSYINVFVFVIFCVSCFCRVSQISALLTRRLSSQVKTNNTIQRTGHWTHIQLSIPDGRRQVASHSEPPKCWCPDSYCA